MLACVVVGSEDGGGRKIASFLWIFGGFFPHFDSTSVHTMCHYCSEERRRGLDLDGASKQKQQWFLLSRLLKLTHAPFGRASPGLKSIWRILQTRALPSTLWHYSVHCDFPRDAARFPSLVGQKDEGQGRGEGGWGRVGCARCEQMEKKPQKELIFFSVFLTNYYYFFFQMRFLKYQSIIGLSWSCPFPFSAFGTCEQWLLVAARRAQPSRLAPAAHGCGGRVLV